MPTSIRSRDGYSLTQPRAEQDTLSSFSQTVPHLSSFNGYADVRAGCGIAVRPDGRYGVSFPLERVPGMPLTSNRAELRAAHAALGLHDWRAEGFGKIVIACDSTYVVRGAVQYAAIWEQNGWKNKFQRDVANKDLWIMLIQTIRNLEAEGTIVQFYHINRNFNGWADSLAKQGAVSGSALEICRQLIRKHFLQNIAEVPIHWIKVTSQET